MNKWHVNLNNRKVTTEPENEKQHYTHGTSWRAKAHSTYGRISSSVSILRQNIGAVSGRIV
jgi:hypothetical protein